LAGWAPGSRALGVAINTCTAFQTTRSVESLTVLKARSFEISQWFPVCGNDNYEMCSTTKEMQQTDLRKSNAPCSTFLRSDSRTRQPGRTRCLIGGNLRCIHSLTEREVKISSEQPTVRGQQLI